MNDRDSAVAAYLKLISDQDSSSPKWIDLLQKTHARLISDASGLEFLILKAHLLVEEVLEIMIDNGLMKPHCLSNRHRESFALKFELAQALGALPDNYVAPIKALNRLRNKLAHRDGYEIKAADLLALIIDEDGNDAKDIRGGFSSDRKTATQKAVALLVIGCVYLVHDLEQRE